MKTFQEAISTLDRLIAPLELETERLPLSGALGRVAVGRYASRLDLPPFDKSAMDGYAICGEDDRLCELEVVEHVPAGRVPTKPVAPGKTVKVMTGAAVPENTAKVVMVEKTEAFGDRVRIVRTEGKPNICRRGEDLRVGDVVFEGPRVVGPVEVGNLVSAGVLNVEAARRVRVSVLSTGDEIVDDPAEIGPGKIMNVNGPVLAALAAAGGLDVVSQGRVPDEPDATRRMLEKALDESDLVVLSGGVSVGDYDFVGDAMDAAGLDVHYRAVAIKPGRPMTFATRGVKAVFGLPGNPVSVYLMFHLFVLRAARRLAGVATDLVRVGAVMAEAYARRKADRTACVPCRVREDGKLEPVEYHGSAHLHALLGADGVFFIERGISTIDAGATVPFVPLGGPFR